MEFWIRNENNDGFYWKQCAIGFILAHSGGEVVKMSRQCHIEFSYWIIFNSSIPEIRNVLH